MRWTSRALALALALAPALAACGGGDDDDCPDTAVCDDPCATGNSFGVGMYCTAGGGECAETPDRLAPFCTVDFDDTAPAFCTRPCEPGNDLEMCGEDAVCTSSGEGGDTGCVPVACTD